MGKQIGRAHHVHRLLVEIPTAGIGKGLGLQQYRAAGITGAGVADADKIADPANRSDAMYFMWILSGGAAAERVRYGGRRTVVSRPGFRPVSRDPRV